MSELQQTVPDSDDKRVENDVSNQKSEVVADNDGDNAKNDDGDDNDDAKSATSSSAETTKTADLLSLATHTIGDDAEDYTPKIGLNRPWGLSEYDDYDVITVHGLRDDHNTVWRNQEGKQWIPNQLFSSMCIRQLDYMYAADNDARIFQEDGIKAEAKELLRLYVEERRKLPETEISRPIIWLCHDIGGTIAKQVLIEAALPTFMEEFENEEAWEETKEVKKRIATLSTGIIFLGCPHKAESLNSLEDELHNLMSLSGPKIKTGIVQKIKNVALQVNSINIEFFHTKLFSRMMSINVFSLEDLTIETDKPDLAAGPELPSTSQDDEEKEKPKAPEVEDVEKTKTSDNNKVSMSMDFLTETPSPFSRYTVTMYTTYEPDTRNRQASVDHADLVRGAPEEFSGGIHWVNDVGARLSRSYYYLRVNSAWIISQIDLLTLAPPTRLPSVHANSAVPGIKKLPVLEWIQNQDEFKSWDTGHGPRILHIKDHREDPTNTAKISQYLYTLRSDTVFQKGEEDGQSTFYFEFNRNDGRYNNVKSFLINYLVDISSRIWHDYRYGRAVERLFQNLEYYNHWSLNQLFILFLGIRKAIAIDDHAIYLGCFDQCVEEERTWFLEKLLDENSNTEIKSRMVITTTGSERLLKDSARGFHELSLENCPVSLKGFTIDEKPNDEGGLLPGLQALLQKRVILRTLRPDLEALMNDCGQAPYLGYTILDWLRSFGRGKGIGDIEVAIRQLRPITPESVITGLIRALPEEDQQRAVQIHHWIKHAKEPLTIEALAHALVALRDVKTWVLEDIDLDKVLGSINNGLWGIITLEGREVKFSHPSFYETTLSDLGEDGEPGRINGQIAETCLRYMMKEEVQERYAKLAIQNYGGDVNRGLPYLSRDDLLEYAIRFWADHYRAAGQSQPHDLAFKFFQTKDVRSRWAEGLYLLSNTFTRIHQSYMSPLPCMAELGLDDLVARQIEENDKQWIEKDLWLAITEAARNGHRDLALKLLALVEPDEQALRKAMDWAVLPGNEAVVDQLIEKIDRLDEFSWPVSMVHRAVTTGYSSLISALSKSGSDLNESDETLLQYPIHTAIYWRQKDAIQRLLELGIDLELRETYGVPTPLAWAVEEGDPDIVQELIDAKANLQHEDYEESLVHRAVTAGQHESLRRLIAAGADFKSGDPGVYDSRTYYPMITGAMSCRVECMRVLLENGADPNVESWDGSGLSILSRKVETIEGCRLLLDNGADPNKTYEEADGPFLQALRTNSKELVELYLEKGADIELAILKTEKRTPLAFAAAEAGEGSLEVMGLLLEKGASVNNVPEEGESALFNSAFRQTDVKKPELLIAHGADVHWKRHDGWTPLHAGYDMPDFVSLFLKNGLDVNLQCDSGTILMMAARWNYPNTVKLLLELDPRPDLETKFTYNPDDDAYNNTVMHFAVYAGNYEIASMLLDAGAQLDEKLQDIRLVIQPCTADDSEEERFNMMVKSLLDHGAKATVVDEEGNTALHGINYYTPVSTIQLLIEAGAPLEAVNKAGRTPIAEAVAYGNVAAVKYLLSKGARVNFYNETFGSLLHLTCETQFIDKYRNVEMIKVLTEAKVDPNAPGPAPEREPLLYNVIRTSVDSRVRHKIVKHLVEDMGMDVNVRGGALVYPVIITAKLLDWRLLRYLIRKGADINVADGQGRRVTHWFMAKEVNTLDMIKKLAKAGADFEAKDKFGRTPLHFAAGFGEFSMIEELLKRLPGQTDINVKDEDGWTPLMWSCRQETWMNWTITRLIDDHKADIWPMSKDGKWSALKLARMTGVASGMEDTALQPPEDERERVGEDGIKQVWKPELHEAELAPRYYGYDCASCLMQLWGQKYGCTVCGENEFILCFKCYPHRAKVHDPEHEFKEIVDEVVQYDVVAEEPRDGDASADGRSERRAGSGSVAPTDSGSDSDDDDEDTEESDGEDDDDDDD